MKRFLFSLLTLIILAGSSLTAQDFAGTWQGTLKAGDHDLRIVLKIAKADGAMTGQMFSIDQGARALPTGPITNAGGNIKFAVPGIGGTYEGKLSPDAKSIAGTWNQGSNPSPLNFAHVTPETAWAMPAQPVALPPMPPDADPSFEVATIKPAKPGEQGNGIMIQGRKFVGRNNTLDNLIAFAYGVHPKQILGGPAWIGSDKYDMDAERISLDRRTTSKLSR